MHWDSNTQIMAVYIVVIIFIVVVFGILRSPKSKGARGERRARWQLSHLPDNYHVFNDLYIPNASGNTSQIDHLVVSNYGIFIIETKNYSGSIYGSEDSEQWTEYFNWFSRSRWSYGRHSEAYKFYNPVLQNRGHIKALRHYLGSLELPVYSIIAFSNQANLNVSVSTACVTYLKYVSDAVLSKKESVLSDGVVDGIVKRLNLLKETATQETKDSHVQSAQQAKQIRNQQIQKGICPRCGGRLVKRQGMYGPFWGCDNYPSCRYTLPFYN